MQLKEICKLENGDMIVQDENSTCYLIRAIPELNIPLKQLSQFLDMQRPYSLEKSQLISLGISQNTLGFKYLLDVLVTLKQDPVYETKITLLFSVIAKKHHCTYSSVDRTIRYALNAADTSSPFYQEMFNTTEHLTAKKIILALAHYSS